MEKPIIAILPLYDEGTSSVGMTAQYIKNLQTSGVIPVVLTFNMTKEDIHTIDRFADGYLFTGGHDINPALYNAEKDEKCGRIIDERDNLEKMVFEQAFESNKPILGICRGFQMINALMGGTLYQDLKSSGFDSVSHTDGPFPNMAKHGARIIKDTPLWEEVKEENVIVNSYHHQGIDKLADGLLPMAISEDNLTEGFYCPSRDFLWAVQWHPERQFDGDIADPVIWECFRKAAIKNKIKSKI